MRGTPDHPELSLSNPSRIRQIPSILKSHNSPLCPEHGNQSPIIEFTRNFSKSHLILLHPPASHPLFNHLMRFFPSNIFQFLLIDAKRNEINIKDQIFVLRGGHGYVDMLRIQSLFIYLLETYINFVAWFSRTTR